MAGKVTDKSEGEHLDHYPLQEGDVVLVDRGYNQPGKKIDLYDALHEATETSVCLHLGAGEASAAALR